MKTSCTHCKCQIVPFFRDTALTIFFWLEFYYIPHLVFKFSWGPVCFRGSWACIHGGCPGTAVSLLTAVIFRAVALGGALPCEYAPGCTCRVRVSAQLCSSCRRCWEPCSNLLCTLLWSFTLSWGRNQPGNSFPSAFEALSWDSSLLAVIQHRIACSSSLASNTALCNCSRWFPSILVKFLCVCFTKACTRRYGMKRSHCLDAKCIAVAGWGQFCYVQVPCCWELAGWQRAETLGWAWRSFVESQCSVLGQSVVLDGHGK